MANTDAAWQCFMMSFEVLVVNFEQSEYGIIDAATDLAFSYVEHNLDVLMDTRDKLRRTARE
jgi:hypothetical protein